MDHLINQVNYSGSPANHMLPHAEVKFFCPLCGTETENYQRKTDVFEKKKKSFYYFWNKKLQKS